MSNVMYKSEIFELVKNLTTINNSVIFRKEDDKILVRHSDQEVTIAYELKAPVEYFNFEEESVAFYDYNEFFNFFKSFKAAEIELNSKKITFKENNSKLEYILAKSEAIKSGSKPFKYSEPDFKIKLNNEDLETILRNISLLKPKKAKIYGNGSEIKIKLFNNLHENNFEKSFAVENISGISEEIDFNIFSDTFLHIPTKRDYEISICKNGFIKIGLVDPNLSLNLITGKVGN